MNDLGKFSPSNEEVCELLRKLVSKMTQWMCNNIRLESIRRNKVNHQSRHVHEDLQLTIAPLPRKNI